jgi:hypothetical protein
MPDRDEKGSQSYLVKGCPYCRTYNKLDAKRCIYEFCGKRIGEVDRLGKAKEVTEWRSYISPSLWWVGLALYIWLLGWWEPFLDQARKLATWGWTVALAVWEVVWDVLVALWDLFLAFWNAVWNLLVAFFNALWNLFSALGNAVWNLFS